MNWQDVIMAIVSAIAGGGLVGILTIREKRRQANADAATVEADAFSKQNEEWQDIVKEYKEQAHQMSELRAEVKELHEKVNRLETANAIALRFYCENKSCDRRCPPFGTATTSHLESQSRPVVGKPRSKKNKKADDNPA